MDCLLFGMTWLDLYGIIMAALGLGVVIFVHELGHFLVARLCGVKCEKFYIGFDLFGLSLAKWHWGETEYGIGVFPLGGYVKMLGQDDNPSNAARELERSRLAQPPQQTDENKDPSRAAKAEGASPPTAPTESYIAGIATPLDPRSYLAKSVPQRMAIISAGVVMNLIFAVVFAMSAYRLGVEYVVCQVSNVLPGEPGWEAGLMPGDQIVQIGRRVPARAEDLRFSDLIHGIALGDVQDGIRLKIRRGNERPFWITPVPRQSQGNPRIGASPPESLTLMESLPAFRASPAGETGRFKGKDQLVAVDGEPLDSERGLMAVLARRPESSLVFTVNRQVEPKSPDEREAYETLTVTVAPNPMRTLGLRMRMGPVAAIQTGSPAAMAGLRVGDVLLRIAGEDPGDPLTLPERLRRLGGNEITLSIHRPETNETFEKTLTLRVPDWYELSRGTNGAVGVPALGIAYRVYTDIEAVDPGSPAARAGIRAGERVTAARLVWEVGEGEKDIDKVLYGSRYPIKMTDQEANWAMLQQQLQWTAPDVRVELTVKSGEEVRTVTVEQALSREYFHPERGFLFRPKTAIRVATSFSDALALGWRETVESVEVVYRTIQKLFSSQVSTENLQGPGSIIVIAGLTAKEGLTSFLMFLTMLSANLAVLNFLPIPILDGGHMVFLAYEGIRGKPPSERVMIGLSYAGLFLLLVLMLYVVGLDIKRLLQYLGWWGPG